MGLIQHENKTYQIPGEQDYQVPRRILPDAVQHFYNWRMFRKIPQIDRGNVMGDLVKVGLIFVLLLTRG